MEDPHKRGVPIRGGGPPWGGGPPLGGGLLCLGGLGPLGVLLASGSLRNRVSGVILTSPPSWSLASASVPQEQMEREFSFFSNPIFGGAFWLLAQSRFFIRFFSDSFLFATKSDEQWVDNLARAATVWETRWPIFLFNAGLTQKDIREDLARLSCPTLLMVGKDEPIASEPASIRLTNWTATIRDVEVQEIDGGGNVIP